jgi:acetyl esterase/lipase
VEERASIRHISRHRAADGTFDLAGNLTLWNTLSERFTLLPLWAEGAPGFDDRDPLQIQPNLIFVPSESAHRRGAIVVSCGGGFQSRTGCEAFHVADFFHRAGYAVAVLTYRLHPYTRLDALADIRRAVRVLRTREEEFCINGKIAVMGFSAGGMLSANCATQFDNGDPRAADEIERRSCRPDAAVVGYGAFSTVSFPGGFFDNPFTDANRAESVYLAPERSVTTDAPPFFIWQTNGDDPRHSLKLATALTECGIPFELHCFPDGAHGLALADGNNDLHSNLPHVAHWSMLCDEWLGSLGF